MEKITNSFEDTKNVPYIDVNFNDFSRDLKGKKKKNKGLKKQLKEYKKDLANLKAEKVEVFSYERFLSFLALQ